MFVNKKLWFFIVFVCCSLSMIAAAQNNVPRPSVKGYEGWYMISADPVVAATSYCELLTISLKRDVYFYNNLEPLANPVGWTALYPSKYKFNCAWMDNTTDPTRPDYMREYTAPNAGQRLYFTIEWADIGYSSDDDYISNEPNTCTATSGNPISIALGEKIQIEEDYFPKGNSPIHFFRYYNSGYGRYKDLGSFGDNWSHTYDRRIIVGSLSQGKQPYVKSWLKVLKANQNSTWLPVTSVVAQEELNVNDVEYAYVIRPNGKSIYYFRNGDEWQTDYGVKSDLTLLPNSEGWLYVTNDNIKEFYDNRGYLIRINNASGQTQTLNYDLASNETGDDNPFTLDRVEDNYGNYLSFSYDSNHRLIQINSSSGDVFQYEYEMGIWRSRLEKIIYQDSTTRIYQYDRSTARHLTSIIDENGSVYASWSYDGKGRAISSEHAGGVDRTSIIYPTKNFNPGNNGTQTSVTVTNSLGKQTTYYFKAIQGLAKITQVEGHPSTNCAAANKNYTYDANGFMESKTDWKGDATTYIHNDRGQELSRVEASGTPQARTIITEWHADFNLPIKISEPARETVMAYDANGRLLSRQVQIRSN
jgi:YD repeat-containing protein